MVISGTIGWFVVEFGQPIIDLLFWRCAFGAVMLAPFASLSALPTDGRAWAASSSWASSTPGWCSCCSTARYRSRRRTSRARCLPVLHRCHRRRLRGFRPPAASVAACRRGRHPARGRGDEPRLVAQAVKSACRRVRRSPESAPPHLSASRRATAPSVATAGPDGLPSDGAPDARDRARAASPVLPGEQRGCALCTTKRLGPRSCRACSSPASVERVCSTDASQQLDSCRSDHRAIAMHLYLPCQGEVHVLDAREALGQEHGALGQQGRAEIALLASDRLRRQEAADANFRRTTHCLRGTRRRNLVVFRWAGARFQSYSKRSAH